MDGRIVLLALIAALAVVLASDTDTARPPGEAARERAVDVVLVEVDRAQQCRLARRREYAETVPSLQFAGGRFMRTALLNDLDIHLATTADGRGYVQRITGTGVSALLERRGTELVRLDVGDRPAPRLAAGCGR